MIWIPIAIGGVIVLALATYDEEGDIFFKSSDKLPSEEEPTLSSEELSEIKRQRNALNRKLKKHRRESNKKQEDS